MSFIGRLFAKKEGGTRVGNFLRQFAHNNTYGFLGSDLQKSYGEILLEGAREKIDKIQTSLLKD